MKPSNPWRPPPVLRDVQLALAERGLYDGLVDGKMGPKTDTAIRSFQQHNGMPEDGVSSPDLLARITASSAPIIQDPTPAAAPPAPSAPAVDQIAALLNGGGTSAPSAPVLTPKPDKRLMGVEKALNSRGYGPLKVDGVMDGKTRNAIARFEREQGLPVTGQVSKRLLQEFARTGTKVE